MPDVKVLKSMLAKQLVETQVASLKVSGLSSEEGDECPTGCTWCHFSPTAPPGARQLRIGLPVCYSKHQPRCSCSEALSHLMSQICFHSHAFGTLIQVNAYSIWGAGEGFCWNFSFLFCIQYLNIVLQNNPLQFESSVPLQVNGNKEGPQLKGTAPPLHTEGRKIYPRQNKEHSILKP